MEGQARSGALPLRAVVWEATRACRFACAHCRAMAQPNRDPRELSTEEVLRLVEDIAGFSKPLFVISGGDPLLREDVFEIASYASKHGLRVAMSPSGSDITPSIVRRMRESGVKIVSISVDGSTEEIHDSFRQLPGAFKMALQSIRYIKEGGLPFQINTTVSKHNMHDLINIYRLAVELGASAWDVFVFIPTGRGRINYQRLGISPQEYEEVLHLIYSISLRSPIPVRMTCSPPYMRVVIEGQRELRGSSSITIQGRTIPSMGARGCLAGNGFAFISHTGDVYGCGFLPIPAGNIRRQSFREIYENSPLFLDLRKYSLLRGRCGVCEFKVVCGGCRARALAIKGSYLEEDPYCAYIPRALGPGTPPQSLGA